VPAHGDRGGPISCPPPIDATVDRVSVCANRRLGSIGTIEVLLAAQHSGEEERGVDRGELDLPEAMTTIEIEEVIEEAPVAGDIAGPVALRRLPQEAQRRQLVQELLGRLPLSIGQFGQARTVLLGDANGRLAGFGRRLRLNLGACRSIAACRIARICVTCSGLKGGGGQQKPQWMGPPLTHHLTHGS
jgi:hypothetical protein